MATSTTAFEVPSTQAALLVASPAQPFTLSSTHPVPTLSNPNDILIRIEATAINPVDWKVQQYGLAGAEWPAIMGSDCAGVVVKVAEGVERVKVGDRVLHQGQYVNRGATFQQYTIANANLVAKIPSSLSFSQAATIPVALSAAAFGLYGPRVPKGGAALLPPWHVSESGKPVRKAYKGKPIVVLGGASSVGQYVIQLARLSGFAPILTTVSPHNIPLVTSLGATHPIPRSTPLSELPSVLTSLTSSPLEVVYDAVSAQETQLAGWELLSEGSEGTLVLVLPACDALKQKLAEEEKKGGKRRVISTYATVHGPVNREVGEEMYGVLAGLLERGDIKPNEVEEVPGGLAGIYEACERMKKGLVSGRKLVVRPQETTTE
ncbi:hypothetical protein EIP91_007242 [Steccherinum ochraceum]|uniref:Enoyl reductase (ER) domain-containing protein n=1 Tax=Steccherinum ochraceum TaxID=92696 RepID=A0A4R0RIQ5_9APHY|nr:hypothetical protein EIP91_007242 [Steccherinum ochraceum]